MTGPDHYRAAERLLDHVTVDDTGVIYDEASSGTMATIAAAQVHATLALAAAVVEGGPEYATWTMTNGWREAGALS